MQSRQPRPGQPQRRRKPAPPPTLGQALAAELKDILQKLWYYIYENVESILKGIVCGLYLVLFLMLQTTFFVEFAPFDAVPVHPDRFCSRYCICLRDTFAESAQRNI